ncbi:hypothetical protein [Flavobacterium tegetincola]|uniref:hypothetical protein n=1 Tax=Flavobacterium tegetincola TaxID=150172 RepID=UPI0004119710|nr:hypothetical protein [Flavobacterium tegetincola]
MKSIKINNLHSLIKAKSLLLFILTVTMIFIGPISTAANGDKNANSTSKNEDKLIFISGGAIVSGVDNLYISKEVSGLYIAPNTIIYGAENLFASSRITKKSIARKKDEITSNPKISKEIVKIDNKSVERIQKQSKKEINAPVYTSKSNRRYDKWREAILSKQLLPSCDSSNYTNAVVCSIYNKDAFKIQKIVKHKRYTSFTYLDFPILRNGVLRGPPCYQTL